MYSLEDFVSDGYYQFSCTRPYEVKHDKAGTIRVTAIFSDGNVLFPAVKYLAQKKINGKSSISWERLFIQAMRLLLDYYLAHKDHFKNAKDMFENFAYRIQFGTVDENRHDPSGLHWRPRSADQSSRIIQKITCFSDWLYNESENESQLLNPLRKATPAEKVLNLAAYNHKINNAFLKHTYSGVHRADTIKYSRNTRVKQLATSNIVQKKSFSEDKLIDLLLDGLKRKSANHDAPFEERYRVDYILITLLMHLGGLRESEVFHLYTDDIIPNNGGQQIRVYHPLEGLAPEHARLKFKKTNLSRKEYLAREFGMLDRLTARGGLHSGWKSPTVNNTGKYFHVFLFGYPELQDYFFKLFRLYLETRVEPLPGRYHPFLFTDKNGDPLKLRTFIQAHNRAVMKIGMVPKLEYGGTPHCHRHSYGQRLADAKIDPLTIKICMHHSSLESQRAYTDPQLFKVSEALKAGIKTLENNVPLSLPDLTGDLS